MRQKLSELIDLIYGFRKIIAFFLLFLVAIIFRLDALIDGGQFVDLMKNVALAFFAANGIEHYTSMIKDRIASQVSSQTPQAPKDDP